MEVKLAILDGPSTFDLELKQKIHEGAATGRFAVTVIIKKPGLSARTWVHNDRKDPRYKMCMKVKPIKPLNGTTTVWSFSGTASMEAIKHEANYPIKGFLNSATRRGHASLNVPDGIRVPELN